MIDLHERYYRFPADFPLPMVLDGATGTALMQRGMPQGCCPEAWILAHPDTVCDIQAGYCASGADAIYAPTFGCNHPTLEHHGFGAQTVSFNRRLAFLSRTQQNVLVGGDLSPTGMLMQPAGEATFDEIKGYYREQAEALRDTVDFFAVETMISLAETCAAVAGIRAVSDLPIFTTLTVDARGRTMSGDTLEAALITLADRGVAAFGCNCSCGPDAMLRVLSPLASLSVALGVPLIAKPNAGMPHEHADGTRSFDLTPADFSIWVPRFLEAGICVLGGCCGTDERFIAEIRRGVDAFDRVPEIVPQEIGGLICNARETAYFSSDGREPIPADEGVFDIEEETGYIRINSREDADFLLENSYMIPVPFAVCGDPEAVSYLRERFCGKL